MFWLVALKHLIQEAELPSLPQPSSVSQKITRTISSGDFCKRCVYFRRIFLFFWGSGSEQSITYLTVTTFQELCFSIEANTRFFFLSFIFYLQAKAKLFTLTCLEARRKAKKIELWQLSVKQRTSEGSKWKQSTVLRELLDLNAW